MPFEREGKRKCFKSPVTHNISYLLPKNMPRHTGVCRATDTLEHQNNCVAVLWGFV